MCKLNIFDKLSFILVLIGSLNWGLVGLFNFNLVKYIFSNVNILEKCIYIIIFISGINLFSLIFRCGFLDEFND